MTDDRLQVTVNDPSSNGQTVVWQSDGHDDPEDEMKGVVLRFAERGCGIKTRDARNAAASLPVLHR